MDMKEKLYNEGGVVFPAGKIVLLDGTALECYPREGWCDKAVDYNNLEFDTTGKYLSFGKKRYRSKEFIEELKQFLERQKFVENAFMLLQNKEFILQDSRMFLAPVAVENCLAYTGTSGFRNPTIGVYLEWWSICKGTLITDENGVRSLVYRMAGSPLSGINSCTAIREDGEERTVNLHPFSDCWRSFMKINQRYSEAKSRYEAFSLQHVIEKCRR